MINLFLPFYLRVTHHPFHPPQVIHRLSVLFTNPLFYIKCNNIIEIRAIDEVFSTMGVGPLYERKLPKKNDNLNI